MNNIAISTAAFCLWDIGPKRKLDICEELGFERIVLAFSTIKMLEDFTQLHLHCNELSKFSTIVVHAPWCGIYYGDNKLTEKTIKCLNQIAENYNIDSVIFPFDNVKNFESLKSCDFIYYIKNSSKSTLKEFGDIIKKHSLYSVLDLNKANRFENHIDDFLNSYSDNIKAIHVSGFIDSLGRTPIIESGQKFLLDKIKGTRLPIVIEGLFSPGDFQSIREEIKIIEDRVYHLI